MLFYSSCDPFQTNPDGGQIFAMRPNGSGLWQVTRAQGRISNREAPPSCFSSPNLNGSTSVVLPGPFRSATIGSVCPGAVRGKVCNGTLIAPGAPCARCGDGMVGPGETCDPPGSPTGCPAGEGCNRTCTACLQAPQIYAPIRVPDGYAGIGTFPKGASGNVSPSRVISGRNSPLATISGIAVDSIGDIFVTNEGSGTAFPPAVVVFDASASGDAIPQAVIAGGETRLSDTQDNSDVVIPVALDAAGNIYVGHNSHGFLPGASGSVVSFAPGSNGNVPPRGVLEGAHTRLIFPQGLTFDRDGRLYVADEAAVAVFVYEPGATGDAAPNAVIEGRHTGLGAAQGIAVDAEGFIYVSNDTFINVYAPGSNGDVAPVRIVGGPGPRSVQATGIAVDEVGRIFISNTADDSVLVFSGGANGDASPVVIIKGAATLLRSPFGLALGR